MGGSLRRCVAWVRRRWATAQARKGLGTLAAPWVTADTKIWRRAGAAQTDSDRLRHYIASGLRVPRVTCAVYVTFDGPDYCGEKAIRAMKQTAAARAINAFGSVGALCRGGAMRTLELESAARRTASKALADIVCGGAGDA